MSNNIINTFIIFFFKFWYFTFAELKFGVVILFILGVCFNKSSIAQDNFTLSGFVTDKQSGESLIDCKIIVVSNGGTYTNEFGFYSITLNAGNYNLEFRYPGYQTIKKNLQLSADLKINIQLQYEEDIQQLAEIEVTGEGKDANISNNQISTIKLDIEQLKTLPAFMGEVDVIKTLQLMPGISSATEGTAGFYVRGGGPDQNLVLLDGVHVYNASHLFGFFSVFNVDAVKSVELTKGGIPANYGGRLSSVLDISMNDGNLKDYDVSGGIGLISSRLTIQGPIQQEKSSFIISGRRTYIDVITKPFIPKDGAFSGSGYFFYDLNAKLNFKFSDRDRIYLSGYYGKDAFTFATPADDFSVRMPWGNGIASLRWNHLFSDKLFLNSRVSLTDYQFQFISKQDEFEFGLNSGIRDYSFSTDLTYYYSPRLKIKFGTEYVNHIFTPFSVSASQDSIQFDVGEAQKLISHETAFFVSSYFEATEKLSLNVGLRYSMYHHVGPFKRYLSASVGNQDSVVNYSERELIQFYNNFEPRFSSRLLLNEFSSIKLGWNYNAQYIHLANLSAVSLPTDIWFPSTDLAKPQLGWQGTIGYFRNFRNNTFESSIEFYYKSMNNLIEFKEGALPQDNVQDNTDNLLTFGRGYSYGAEFFLSKAIGDFTGWIGYTISKTNRQFNEIYDGNCYPAKYDRRHDLSVVGNYKLSKSWTFGASFVYASGNTMTLPTSWYLNNGDIQFQYGPRNASRMAPFHRLDLSVTWYDKSEKRIKDPISNEEKVIKKRFRNNLNFSIYNVYSRQNPFFLYVDNDGSLAMNDFSISLKQVSLFPILPSITWNFKF